LLDIAWKAARKPARGGISNLLCIAEPLDVLTAELGRVADRVSVILPWGSLLRAVACPEIGALRQIASLCLPGARIEIVLSYDAARDARENAPLGVTTLNQQQIAALFPSYEEVGIPIISAECISPLELAAYQTTWAKRLANGRPRDTWRIRAQHFVSSR
jgi:16S rRNA (adenine(1408)-N(1))-methyltransferase